MYVGFEVSSRPAEAHVLLRLDNHILHLAPQYKFELLRIRKLRQSLIHPKRDNEALNNPCSLPLQRRFEVNACTFPGAPAVKMGDKLLTYIELDRQADALALHLQRRGLRPGGFCLVKLGPSLAEVRAILAILKAGAAYVQCDPQLTPHHEAIVIDVLEPSFLFVHEGEAAQAESSALEIIPCEDEAMELPYGWPDEILVGSRTPACALVSAELGEGVSIWMRTHKSLAAPDSAGPAANSATSGRLLSAYRDPLNFWRVLSRGALLTIPDA